MLKPNTPPIAVPGKDPAPVTPDAPKEAVTGRRSLQFDASQVTHWLKANNAEAYVGAFFDKGFYYVEDIDDEALKDIVKEPGTRRMLGRLVKEKKERPAPAIPKVPDGTPLDLSSKDLAWRDGVGFTLPAAIQVSADGKKVIAPCELKREEWMVIARNSCLLYGRRMDGCEPAIAQFPVLVWRAPSSDRFVRSEHLAAEVKTEVTYTESASNYVSQGFTKVTATAGFPFCSASFAREHTEKHAASCKRKQLFMTGIWHYPRARILLEECSAVSPEFVNDVREALGIRGSGDLSQAELDGLRDRLGADLPTDSQQQEGKQAVNRLARVLLKYGHVVGWNVELGGRLFFSCHRSDDGQKTFQERKDTTSAAVALKTSFAGGEAGVARGSGTSQDNEAHQIAETMAFTALGGDTVLASAPNAWASTVKDPNLWAVVSLDEVRTTVSLLPDSLRGEVERLWRRAGRGGPLDGRQVELRCSSIPKRLLVLGTGNEHVAEAVEPYKRYDPLPGTSWSIVAIRDDMYCFLHTKTGLLLGVDPRRNDPPLRSFAATKLKESGCHEAVWRVFPVDPGAVHGDEFANHYFVLHVASDQLLSSKLTLVAGSVLDADPRAESARPLMWDLSAVDIG